MIIAFYDTNISIRDSLVKSVSQFSSKYKTKIIKNQEELINNNKNYFALIINIGSLQTIPLYQLIKSRTSSNITIGISYQRNASQKLSLLRMGLTDIIEYPFKIEELTIKLQNYLKIFNNSLTPPIMIKEPQARYRLSNKIILDTHSRILLNDNFGIYLNKPEFSIINSLLKNNNQLISFAQLGNLIRTSHTEDPPTRNLISSYVSSLRRKAKKVDIKLNIRSIYGYGYYFKHKFCIPEVYPEK